MNKGNIFDDAFDAVRKGNTSRNKENTFNAAFDAVRKTNALPAPSSRGLGGRPMATVARDGEETGKVRELLGVKSYTDYDADYGKTQTSYMRQLQNERDKLQSVNDKIRSSAAASDVNTDVFSRAIADNERRITEIGGLLSTAERDYNRYLDAGKAYYTRNVTQKSDFAAKSRPVQSDDIKYNYINDLNGVRKNPGFIIGKQYRDYKDYYDYSFMEPEERGIYNYIYATEGEEKADKYLDWIKSDLSKRRFDYINTQTKEWAKEHRILGSLKHIPDNLVGGIRAATDITGQTLANTITGRPIDFYSRSQQQSANAAAETEGVSEYLAEKYPQEIAGVNVASFLYNTGMSAIDSLVAAKVAAPIAMSGLPAGFEMLPVEEATQLYKKASKLAGAIGGTLLATNAGVSAMRDIKDRGGTDEQAILGGTAAGVFEALFESWSIENIAWLQSAADVPTKRAILKEVAKSALTNASEEFNTELANVLFDAFVLGDASEWRTKIEKYMMEPGVTESEARAQAMREAVIQIVESTLSGGLMGAGFGFAGGRRAYRNTRANNALQAAMEAGRTAAQEESELRSTINEQTPTTAETQQETVAAAETQQADQSEAELESYLTRPETRTDGRIVLPTAEEASRQARARNASSETQRSGILSGAADADVETAEKLRKLFGREIIFYNKAAGEAGVENGHFLNGKIYVNVNGANPVKQIITHELTHSLENTAAYRSLQNLVTASLRREGTSIRQERAKIKELYAKNGVTLKNRAATAEIVANYASEHLFENETEIRELVRMDRSLGERIHAWIDNVLSIFRGGDARTENLLQRAKEMYARALAEAGGLNSQEDSYSGQSFSDAIANDERFIALRQDLENGTYTQEQYDELFDQIVDSDPYLSGLIDNEAVNDAAQYSFSRTQNMSWKEQMDGYFGSPRTIKSSDSLYLGESNVDGVQDSPLYIPLSVITKAMRKEQGSRSGHRLTEANIRALKNGIDEAPAVIHNPARNAIVYITGIRNRIGEPVIAAFDLNNNSYGTNAHKATSIHGRGNLIPMLTELNEDATVIVKNENKLNTLLPGEQIRSLKLRAKVELVGDNIAENLPGVKQFSLSAPVEQKGDLVAVHNLREDDLRGALNLGGFPMPSIAVMKANGMTNSQYGDISIVFGRDTIDPKLDSSNKVYGGDAWTPTRPQVDYPINDEVERAFQKRIDELSPKIAEGAFNNANVIGSLGVYDSTSKTMDEIVSSVANDRAVMAAYLADQGETLEPVRKDKVFNKKFGNESLQKFIDAVGPQRLAEMEADLAQEVSIATALGDDSEILEQIMRDYYAEAGESLLMKQAERRGWTPEEIEEKRQRRIDNAMEHNVTLFTYEDFIHDAWHYYEDAGTTKDETDYYRTLDALRERVNTEDVEEWVRPQLEQLLGEPGIYNGKDPYTASGARRSFEQLHNPVTLENLVKAMRSTQSERGAGLWGATPSGLISVATPQYNSIDELKADSGRLGEVDSDSYQAYMSDMDEQITDIINKIQNSNKAYSDNVFIERDNIASAIINTAAAQRTIQGITRALRSEGYTVDTATAQELLNLYNEAASAPTGYFEAKPQRAVKFDEVKAAVVPDLTRAEMIAALKAEGLNVIVYPHNNQQARVDAINSIPDIQFSISPAQQAQEQEKKQNVISQLRRYINGEISRSDVLRMADRSPQFDSAMGDVVNDPDYVTVTASDEAREIINEARRMNVSVDEYIRANWDEYEYDGGLNEAAREALQIEKRAGRGAARYSYSASAAAAQTDDSEINKLPAKAADYLKRTERKFADGIARLLSVPSTAKRDYLHSVIRGITNEYLRTGTVSDETRTRAFNEAYDRGMVVEDEYYNQYKELKDTLRKTAITLSEYDKTDIADWGSFRQNAFGSLRLVNEGGMPVDVFYQEQQQRYPEQFPKEITAPSDQLIRLLEVAQSIEKTERTLDQYYGSDAGTIRQYTQYDFDKALDGLIGELRYTQRYADERNAPRDIRTPLTIDEVKDAYAHLKNTRRVYERVRARTLLTQEDMNKVNRLLKGELTMEDIKDGNVEGIRSVYEAKADYEQYLQAIREFNGRRKQELRDLADSLLTNISQFKDKKMGLQYARETMERNIRDIAPDSKTAEALIDEYIKPIHKAEAQATRGKNEYRDRVRKLGLSRKVAKGNLISEAHAVQLLGEALDNIRVIEESRGRITERDGKSLSDWRGIEQAIARENPNLNMDKIRGAINEFRTIYDELFQKMNDVRVENGYEPINYRQGYFPHFQPGDDGILAQFARAIGIDGDVTELPTTIAGLTHTFKPGIQWFGNAQQRIGFNTAYDAVEGFDKYIEGCMDIINQTENIQKLRALASQIRYNASDEGIKKQIDDIRAMDLSEEDKQNRINAIYENGRYAMSGFVQELDEYTNLLANKKSKYDRGMEQLIGRGRLYNIGKALTRRLGANMVAINPGSWLTNYIPLTQGWAELGSTDLLRGMYDTVKSFHTDDGIVNKSTFLTNRKGSDTIVKSWQQAIPEKISFMEHIDQFTAGSLVRAKYAQNLAAGMSETMAMEDADDWVAGVMADRSKGSMPTLFASQNPAVKVFTQFQLEVNNQLSYLLKDIPRRLRDKGIAALTAAFMKFFIGAFLYNEIYEYFFGRRAAFDPFGILNDTVGDLTGYELPNLVELGVGAVTGDMPSFKVNKVSGKQAAANLVKEAAEDLPFIGGLLGGGRLPINSALPSISKVATALDRDSDNAMEKRLSTLGKEALKPALYLVPPFGGGQAKKLLEGVKAVLEGGSYSMNNQGEKLLQYPVFSSNPLEFASNLGRAAVFGKSSLPEARNWVESDFDSLSRKETAAYQGLIAAGDDARASYDLIRELGKVEKTDTESKTTLQLKMLEQADFSKAGKGAVFYAMFASDDEAALLDSLESKNADIGEAAGVLMEFRDINRSGLTDKTAAKADAISSSGLSSSEKIEMYANTLGKSTEKTQSRYDKLIDKGLSDKAAYDVSIELDLLQPVDGRKSVTDLQKYCAIVGSGISDRDQYKAFAEVMYADTYAKLTICDTYGVTPKMYTQVKVLAQTVDDNNNLSQAEAKTAINQMSWLSNEQKAILWQIQNKSWKGNKNPYNRAIGAEIYALLQAAGNEQPKTSYSYSSQSLGNMASSVGIMLPASGYVLPRA